MYDFDKLIFIRASQISGNGWTSWGKFYTEKVFYFFTGEYGVETYLELFSEDNFDAFCLAYMFTYRDFEGGTLGLAWTGDLQNAGESARKTG